MPSKRAILKLSSQRPYLPPMVNLLEQLPLAELEAEGWSVVWNAPVQECTAWIVLDGVTASDSSRCPPENTLLITAEPTAFKRFDSRWVAQFSHVASSQRRIVSAGAEHGYAPLPWFVRKSWAQVHRDAPPPKHAALSTVCSARHSMQGHRRRLRCLRHLQDRFPGRIDWFGRKIRTLDDKWDGLAPYRYSIAIENSRERDYWSEKIVDCYLARTIPIYDGAPNIADYFPADSMLRIDIDNPDSAEGTISRILAAPEALYRRMLPAVEAARAKYLQDYSFGASILRWCRRFDKNAVPSDISFSPEPEPTWFARKAISFRRRWLGTT